MSRGCLIVLVLVFVPEHARAFAVSRTNGLPIRWTTTELGYWLDSEGSADVAGTADLDAVRAGVRSWNDVDCSPVAITERGSTTAEPFLVTDETDGRNVIAWIEDSRWSLGSRVLAVTTPVYNTVTGQIVDADIAMNGYSVTWSTSSSHGVADVESVAVHELGHFLGLQHVLGGELLDDPPTMAPYMDPQLRTRTLTTDDATGLCYLYPAGSYACGTDDDCPYILDTDETGAELYTARVACSSGACSGLVPQEPGSGELGDLCGVDEDCAGGAACTQFGGQGYCSQSCTAGTAGACPGGFTCVPTGGSAAGSCFPDSALGGANCPCDEGPGCEAACVCDLDCVCACDTSTACEEDCDCDADCDGGCSAAPTRGGGGTATVALLFFAFVIMFARAERRRRGGAHSGQV